MVTYWSGVVDESNLCRLGDTPYGLTELLGLRRTEIDGMYDGETRRLGQAERPARRSGHHPWLRRYL